MKASAMTNSVAIMDSKAEEYRESLKRVEIAIGKLQEREMPVGEKEGKMREMEKLREDLTLALGRLVECPTTAAQIYVGTQLTQQDVGALANVYFETDQQWYPALLEEIDTLDKSAVACFYGFNERVRVPFTFIQLVPVPVFPLQEGTEIEALYTRDGKWHPATIEGVNGDLVCVKYRKWPTKENIRLPYIRLSADSHRTLTDRAVFEVPDKLKVLPNDPSDVREMKKKRVKAMKKSWRQQQHEKASAAYQSSWKTFKQTTEASSLTKLHKSSLFRSPDTVEGKVGVTGSGQGVTHFQDKVKWTQAFPKQLEEPESPS